MVDGGGNGPGLNIVNNPPPQYPRMRLFQTSLSPGIHAPQIEVVMPGGAECYLPAADFPQCHRKIDGKHLFSLWLV